MRLHVLSPSDIGIEVLHKCDCMCCHNQTASMVVNHKDIISYLRKVTTCPHNHLHGNHFTRFENLMHYFLIKLATLVVSETVYMLPHTAAVN